MFRLVNDMDLDFSTALVKIKLIKYDYIKSVG